MVDPIATEYKGLTCSRCCTVFDITTKTGPVLTCDACADILLGVIWGGTVTGRDKFGVIIVEVPKDAPGIPGSVSQPARKPRRHRKRHNGDRRNGSNRGNTGEGKDTSPGNRGKRGGANG